MPRSLPDLSADGQRNPLLRPRGLNHKLRGRAVAIIDGWSHDCAELLGDEDCGVLDLDRIGAERQVRSMLLGRAHRQDQDRLADARYVIRPRQLPHQHASRSITHLFPPNLPIAYWPIPAPISAWDPFV